MHHMTSSATRPLTVREIGRELGLDGTARRTLKRALDSLVSSGRLIRIRGDRFAIPSRVHLVTGKISISGEGNGTLFPEDGSQKIHVPLSLLNGAMNSDRVVVRQESTGRRGPSGRVIRILERAASELVAVFKTERGINLARPYSRPTGEPILITDKIDTDVNQGQLVLVKILESPEPGTPATGTIIKVLGDPQSTASQTMAVINTHGIPHHFPEKVTDDMSRVNSSIPASQLKQREDLRDLPFVTIDGVNARDFDDALYAERQGDNIVLFVAIADVSHYVKHGSATDMEARRRGNSAYFPDMVVPMLPEILSNDLCSLKPDVDRLSLVCRITVNGKGEPVEHFIFPGVIRSSARLTYLETEKHFTGEESSRKIRGDVAKNLTVLQDLFKVLTIRRVSRHSLDFDFPEPEVVLNFTGHVENIYRAKRYTSHRLVEECMLLANEMIARTLNEGKVGVYRIHEPPDEERVMDLNRLLSALGSSVPLSSLKNPKPFSYILREAQGTPRERFLNTVILRSMMRARYSPDPEGHFALALSDYAHFTSPIRRYADLMVHRILKGMLGYADPYDISGLEDICDHITETERTAENAQRDLLSFLRAKFMEDKIGQEFTGVISGVTSFGMFVEIQEYYVEGLIHMSALHNDYYRFMEDKLCLVGEHTGQMYRIGDELKVRLYRVDLPRRYIDFELADNVNG